MVNFSIGGTMGLFAPSKKDKKIYKLEKENKRLEEGWFYGKEKDKKSYVQKKILFLKK